MSPGRTCSATSASRAPPAPRSAADGTVWTTAWPAAIPWWWRPSTASVELGRTPSGPSARSGTAGSRFVSLAEAEAQWTRYLEAEEGSPEAFFGQILTMFAAWVADQELESIKRRTRDGLERARQQGKALGTASEGRPRAAGCDEADAGRRSQPTADRRRVRMLAQHHAAGAAAGERGLTNPILPRTRFIWWGG